MNKFQKIISILRANGIGVVVKNLEGGKQRAIIECGEFKGEIVKGELSFEEDMKGKSFLEINEIYSECKRQLNIIEDAKYFYKQMGYDSESEEETYLKEKVKYINSITFK